MAIADIELLDSGVIDQIAAGEVVERPAAVLKELSENALDAGASHLAVEIVEGGLSLLQVTDDGHGMTPDNAERALMRHATSKLRTLADLDTICTAGFRGEALSSIAAVSRLTLLTRTHDAAAGYRIEVHGGEVVSRNSAGAPIGTSVIVRDLFYNVPVRRKFLRSPATEQAHLCDALLRVMLGARQGSATLRQQRRTLVSLPENPDLIARLKAAFGPRLGTLVPLCAERGAVKISGALLPPERHRTGTLGLWCFVNGRFVRERMVARALCEGLRLPSGTQPSGFVFVDVDPRDIDVNVHPQKLEVRFGAPEAVFRAVCAASEQLSSVWPADEQALTPTGRAPEPEQGASFPRTLPPSRGAVLVPQRPSRPMPLHQVVSAAEMDAAAQSPLPIATGAAASAPVASKSLFAQCEPLGEAPAGQLACRLGPKLALIEIAEAHAQMLKAALVRDEGVHGLKAERLIVPPVYNVPDALAAVLDDYAIEVASAQAALGWGMMLEPVGPGRWLVAGLPQALGSWAAPEDVLATFASTLAERNLRASEAWQHQRSEVLATWCAAMASLGTPWRHRSEKRAEMRRWLAALGSYGVSYAHVRLVGEDLRFVAPRRDESHEFSGFEAT